MITVRDQLQAPSIGQAIPGPFSLADVDALKKSLLKAGFIVATISYLNFVYSSAESNSNVTVMLTLCMLERKP